MIHFNELYVTDDGKHLVIDTEIDDIGVYDSCLIEKVEITTAESCCSSDSTSWAIVSDESEVKYFDFNEDGVVDDKDKALIDRLFELWDKVDKNAEFVAQYDVNHDGEVDLNDVEAIINKIVHSKSVDGYNYDVNDDNAVDIVDVNTIILAILGLVNGSDLTSEEKSEFSSLFDQYKSLIDDGKDKSSVLRKHRRFCLDKNSESIVSLLGANADLSAHLFIVKVTAYCSAESLEAIEGLGCSYDTNTLTGAAFYGYPLYRNFLDQMSTNGSSDSCETSINSMADYILQYYAMDFALRTGDWCTAQEYWKSLLGGGSMKGSTSKGCGCHGTY